MKVPHAKVDAEIKTDSTGDVAFLLVVFFVLTASFAAVRGIEFDLPDNDPIDTTDGRESVLIAIAADGSVAIDCRPMPAAEILGYLAPRLTRNPNKPVVVYPAESAPYRSLVGVLDVLATAPRRGFTVENVQVCTPKIVQDYIAVFETDPFADHCGGGTRSEPQG